MRTSVEERSWFYANGFNVEQQLVIKLMEVIMELLSGGTRWQHTNVAIGYNIKNTVPNSTKVLGALYSDGAVFSATSTGGNA